MTEYSYLSGITRKRQTTKGTVIVAGKGSAQVGDPAGHDTNGTELCETRVSEMLMHTLT